MYLAGIKLSFVNRSKTPLTISKVAKPSPLSFERFEGQQLIFFSYFVYLMD
jgi:hypothetical protein